MLNHEQGVIAQSRETMRNGNNLFARGCPLRDGMCDRNPLAFTHRLRAAKLVNDPEAAIKIVDNGK